MKRLLPLIFLGLLGCGGFGPYIPPTPIPAKDDNCPAACKHLRDLGCPEGAPLPDGTTCEKFCLDTQAAGHALRPSCILTLLSCNPEEMERCQGPREVLDD